MLCARTCECVALNPKRVKQNAEIESKGASVTWHVVSVADDVAGDASRRPPHPIRLARPRFQSSL